ncbi:hypothetical protein TNCV_715491 [Trichonephila clavipes]|nr:hypothetical protein TNCV_715491 [Trichonephila clavipes]
MRDFHTERLGWLVKKSGQKGKRRHIPSNTFAPQRQPRSLLFNDDDDHDVHDDDRGDDRHDGRDDGGDHDVRDGHDDGGDRGVHDGHDDGDDHDAHDGHDDDALHP